MHHVGSPTAVGEPEVTGATFGGPVTAGEQLMEARSTLGNQMLFPMLMLITMSLVMLRSPLMMLMETLQKEAHPTMRHLNLRVLRAPCTLMGQVLTLV